MNCGSENEDIIDVETEFIDKSQIIPCIRQAFGTTKINIATTTMIMVSRLNLILECKQIP